MSVPQPSDSYEQTGKEKDSNASLLSHDAVDLDATPRDSKTGTGYAALDEEKLGFTGSSSVAKGVYNILCAVIGAGMLSLPGSLRNSSWYGLIMLVAFGCIATYTGILISICLDKDPVNMRSYADIGQAALGKGGKITVFICQITSCIGCCIVYLILSGENIASLMIPLTTSSVLLSSRFWSIICALVVLPLCYFANLHDFAFAALLGSLLSLMTAVCIFIGTFLVPASEVFHVYGNVSFRTVLKAFSTMAFTYAAHAVFPDIKRVMRYPRKFDRVIYWSMSITTAVYIATATVGYYQFGEHAESNILLNLGTSVPAIIGKIAITLHVLLGYVVYINPVFYAVERRLGVSKFVHTKEIMEQQQQQTQEEEHAVFDQQQSLNDPPLETADLVKDHESSAALDNEQHDETLRKRHIAGDSSLERPSNELTASSIEPSLPSTDITDINVSSTKETVPESSSILPDLQNETATITTAKSKKTKRVTAMYRRVIHKMSWTAVRIAVRTLLWALTLAVAVFLPFFGDLMSLLGASALSLTFMVLPALFHVRLFKQTLSWRIMVLDWFLVVLGCVAGGIASVLAIIDIVNSAKHWHF